MVKHQAGWVMYAHPTGPGFKAWRVWYIFYRASDWLPPYQHHKVERSLVCVEGRGLPSVRILCKVGCHVLCLLHDIPMRQHIGQSNTDTKQALFDLRCYTTLKHQTNKLISSKQRFLVILLSAFLAVIQTLTWHEMACMMASSPPSGESKLPDMLARNTSFWKMREDTL